MKIARICLTLLCFICFSQISAGGLSLKENLKKAQAGDYIVTAQDKTYTLLHIISTNNNLLVIQEISIPNSQVAIGKFSWADWLSKGAPGNTCWTSYTVDTNTGQMQDMLSCVNKVWYRVKSKDVYLPTLLTLNFAPIADRDRKKIGSPLCEGGTGGKVVWNPPMIVNGRRITGVKFNAWRTEWPKDNTELSGKTVDVYLPQESDKYPSYFPYWLQVSNFVGSSQLRVVDSGSIK